MAISCLGSTLTLCRSVTLKVIDLEENIFQIRYGGPGILRRPCQLRQCIQPLLPNSVCCSICGLDGWFAETNIRLVE